MGTRCCALDRTSGRPPALILPSGSQDYLEEAAHVREAYSRHMLLCMPFPSSRTGYRQMALPVFLRLPSVRFMLSSATGQRDPLPLDSQAGLRLAEVGIRSLAC